jgi:hypothetical protein
MGQKAGPAPWRQRSEQLLQAQGTFAFNFPLFSWTDESMQDVVIYSNRCGMIYYNLPDLDQLV